MMRLGLALSLLLGCFAPFAIADGPVGRVIAEVPAHQRLGHTMWSAQSATANDSHWRGANVGEAFPAGSTRDWFIVAHARSMGGATIRNIFGGYINSTTEFRICLNNPNPTFIWERANLTSINLSIDISSVYSLSGASQMLALERRGDTLTMYYYVQETDTLLTATTAITATSTGDDIDVFNTHVSSIVNLGGYANTGGAVAVGCFLFATCPVGTTLDDYDLDTEAKIKALIKDPQRIFTHVGFSPDNVRSFGNYADSSGNLIDVTVPVAPVAGNRLVCPFSGTYFTFHSGANGDGMVFPPYTMPASSLEGWNIVPAGSQFPAIIETDGCLLAAAQCQAPTRNPCFHLMRLDKQTGKPCAWPILIDARLDFIDSSASNAQGAVYHTGNISTHLGDTHSATAFCLHGGRLRISSTGHNDSYANEPASGDQTMWSSVPSLLGDNGLQVFEAAYDGQPWGSAFSGNEAAYEADVASYSAMCVNSVGDWIEAHRNQGQGNGRQIGQAFSADGTAYWQPITDFPTGDFGAGLPVGNITFSDGYTAIVWKTRNDNGSQGYYGTHAILAPPAADFNDDSAWYTPTGHAVDGTVTGELVDGFAHNIEALGTIKLQNPHLMLPSDNRVHIAGGGTPTGAIDEERATGAVRFQTATTEGFVIIKGVGEGEISRTNGLWITQHVFERYTYDSANKTLTRTHSIDITADSQSLVGTAASPHVTYFSSAVPEEWQNQPLTCHSIRGNDLLVVYAESDGVELLANEDTPGLPTLYGQNLVGLYWPDVVNNPTYRVPTGTLFALDRPTEGRCVGPVLVGDGNTPSSFVGLRIPNTDPYAAGHYPIGRLAAVNVEELLPEYGLGPLLTDWNRLLRSRSLGSEEDTTSAYEKLRRALMSTN